MPLFAHQANGSGLFVHQQALKSGAVRTDISGHVVPALVFDLLDIEFFLEGPVHFPFDGAADVVRQFLLQRLVIHPFCLQLLEDKAYLFFIEYHHKMCCGLFSIIFTAIVYYCY